MSTLDDAMTENSENVYQKIQEGIYVNHNLQDNNNPQIHRRDEGRMNAGSNEARSSSSLHAIPSISQTSSKSLPQINQPIKQEISTSKRHVSSRWSAFNFEGNFCPTAGHGVEWNGR